MEKRKNLGSRPPIGGVTAPPDDLQSVPGFVSLSLHTVYTHLGFPREMFRFRVCVCVCAHAHKAPRHFFVVSQKKNKNEKMEDLWW